MTNRFRRTESPTAQDLMHETKLLIPLWMQVSTAADLLEEAEIGVAPVVDSRGRCVGLFMVDDYQRWLDRGESDAEPVLECHPLMGSDAANEVRHHISGQFAAAMQDTSVDELALRLDAAEKPYLVVLDRQTRPRGIVCALDVLTTESNGAQRHRELVVAN